MAETGFLPAQKDTGRKRIGQTLAEYAVILTLIALVCVGAVALLGGSIRSAYDGFNGSF